jgi:hypothetical protein
MAWDAGAHGSMGDMHIAGPCSYPLTLVVLEPSELLIRGGAFSYPNVLIGSCWVMPIPRLQERQGVAL